MAKVFVMGIDGAPPEYIFGEWLEELPNIKKLINNGCYGKLNSTIPPLSAIAWSSMTTGKNPADLGFFEYIYRKNHSYETNVITSKNVREKTIWQIASEQGKKSIVLMMPLVWPIKPFNGIMVGGFMTPGLDSEYAYPKEIKEEINKMFNNEFEITNQDFRDVQLEKVLENVYRISRKHFKLVKEFVKNKEWDLFFCVPGQSDPLNHNFIKFTDKNHRAYDIHSKFKDSMKEYYKFVDKELGEIIEILDKDTRIIFLSDHGIKRMNNRMNLSDWLIKHGYLVLNQKIEGKKKLEWSMIDWSKTRAWAIGAYDAQIFINLKNREPEGIVEEKDYDRLVEELSERLKSIKGDKNEKLDTRIFTKKDFIGKHQNDAPDLVIYFDNLDYGANTALIGTEVLWSPESTKGKDDSCHSQQGVFIMNKRKGNLGEIEIIDVAPTILNELRLEIPEDINGKII